MWIIVGQGPTALAVGASEGCLDIFSRLFFFFFFFSFFFLFFLPLWETARYRLKYGLKGPLNLNQQTNCLHLHTALESSQCLEKVQSL